MDTKNHPINRTRGSGFAWIVYADWTTKRCKIVLTILDNVVWQEKNQSCRLTIIKTLQFMSTTVTSITPGDGPEQCQRDPTAAMQKPRKWWRLQLEHYSVLLALCEGSSPVTAEFPSQRPVTRFFMFSLICAWINGRANNRDTPVIWDAIGLITMSL